MSRHDAIVAGWCILIDHHGGCQEHGFLSLGPGEKCPNQEAHELLVRHGIREDTA